MVRALVVALAIAACWHGAVSPPHVTVRLARDDEFPSPQPIGPFGMPDTTCQLEGADAPEIRDAVVAFARTHLLSDLDGLTGFSAEKLGIETPLEATGCNHPAHRDGYFAQIIVKPRTRLGQLELWQRELFKGRCTWGAEVHYCLHVTSDASGTTVVVEKRGSMVGRLHRESDSRRASR